MSGFHREFSLYRGQRPGFRDTGPEREDYLLRCSRQEVRRTCKRTPTLGVGPKVSTEVEKY